MDSQLIQTILYVIFVIMTGIVYSVWNYITKTTLENFEWKRMVASAIFGLFIGIIGVYLGMQNGADITQVNWGYMAGLFLAYSGALVYINRGIDLLWSKLFGNKVLATG